MIRYLKIYWPFAENQIKSNFAYKGRFYLYILRKFIGMFIYYYLWMAIYASSGSGVLGGFTRTEMIVYVFLSYTISDVIMVDISSEIGRDVIDGNVAMNLIKPIDYRMNLVFKSFGIMLYRLVIPALFIWCGLEIYKVVNLDVVPINFTTAVCFLCSLFLSFLLYVFFDYCFGMLAFVTTYLFGMNIIKNAVLNFLTGKLIPISFFPLVLQRIFEFLPFTAMTYVPTMIYLGKYTGKEVAFELGKQVFWVVIFYVVGSILWKKISKRLIILGG